ncbi:MAG: 2-dehydropantoate 2-reductase [Rhodospirillales bacterium]|nr:2-dehydropantoate 2-reductase [Rhodospirillales bacterium]
MSQKIAVLGTGANGSCIAASLVEAGHDVILIDQWPAHVEAMRTNGLRITMPETELHLPVRAHHLCDVCALNETFDVVLLAMKAYDTRWSCEMIKPYLAPDGMLIGMQNGMVAGTILDVIGPERTIGCVVELSSEMFTPGLVKRNTPPKKTWIGLGNMTPVTEHRLAEMHVLLSPVGKVEIKRDILAAKWSKLIVNAMCLGPFAMVGLTMFDALQLPGMRELIIEIGEEAAQAGHDLGHPLEPILGLTQADLAATNRPIEKLFDTLASHVGPGRGRNTVLQDLLKGRASEVGMINGLVVEEAKRRGRAAPANARIVEITRQIEAGTLKPTPANMEMALGPRP